LNAVDIEQGQAARLLDHLDQANLAKAFRGELVPQHPNDEPASVLLERIRAERQEAPKVTKSERRPRRPAAMKVAKRKEGTMGKKRNDVEPTHLTDTLVVLGGKANAQQLWMQSEMEIDEFYKQLRDEIAAGGIKEGADKEELEIVNAA